jgi:hypothetical protein
MISLVGMLRLTNVHSFTPAWSAISSVGRCHSKTLPSHLFITRSFQRLAKISDNDEEEEILGPLASVLEKETQADEGKAITRTVNERLQAELEELKRKEMYGSKSSIGKKIGLDSFASTKTDEERQASIEEARDLNGVNPVVALGGAAFALTAAAGLWILTSYLAEVFATHPVETDVYFVQRVASVFRNVVMGLTSLASGFFGVCGFGLLLLGFRVAYGVATGELDPTPIKTKKQEIEMPNVWELMTSQKGRRGRRD